jgi:GDPmannose 4,6-dehydratase
MFNHESPLRGLDFVSRKISDGVAKIKLGFIEHIELGNLNAKRDWGYAKDYVEGMWLMMQHHKPDTYILATKRTESVRFFTEKAFNVAGIDIKFVGEGEEEVGINAETGKIILKVSPQYFRPVDVDFLLGDPEKARNDLKWQSKTSLESLIKMMVEADLARNISGRVF